MPDIFEEQDFDVVQLMYGFVLIASAMLAATVLVGNILALTGFVCLMLLKDGLPNFFIGAMKVSKRKKVA